MMKNKYVIRTFFVFILGVLFSSCVDRGVVFDESKSIEPFGWSADSVVSFEVEIADTMQLYTIGARVRNLGNYQFQNLWLFVEELAPDSTVICDTVQFFLADNFGRWYGSGIGSLYSNLYLYRDSVHYSNPGVYTYTLRHGMRVDELSGINDIGLKVVIKEDGEE